MSYRRARLNPPANEVKKAKKSLKWLREAISTLYSRRAFSSDDAYAMQLQIDNALAAVKQLEYECVARQSSHPPPPPAGPGFASAHATSPREERSPSPYSLDTGGYYYLARFKLDKSERVKGESDYGFFMLRTHVVYDPEMLALELGHKHGRAFKVFMARPGEKAYKVYEKGKPNVATLVFAPSEKKAIKRALERNNMTAFLAYKFVAEAKKRTYFEDWSG